GFGPCEQFDQRGLVEIVAGAKIGLVGTSRELVPGTDELAVVATENAIADQRSQCDVDAAFVFDSEIGNATSGVQLVRCNDRLRGTDVDAAHAGTAMRACGRVDG